MCFDNRFQFIDYLPFTYAPRFHINQLSLSYAPWPTVQRSLKVYRLHLKINER